MQVGVNSGALKNVGRDFTYKSKVRFESEQKSVIATFIITFLLSRVVLFIGQGDIVGMAPFGIVFLMAMIMTGSESKVIASSIAGFIGYFTIINELSDIMWYIATILMFLVYSLILTKLERKSKIYVLYGIVFTVQILSGLIAGGYTVGLNFTLAAINTVVLVPIYYVINYGLRCAYEYNSNYFFNVEELISIALILCLMVAGVGGVTVFDLSIRNILGYLMIMLISYLGGAANGTAIGVAMGIVIGISSGNMITGVGFYAVIGLVCGLFKDTGKVFSFLSSILIYFILALYSKDLTVVGSSEVILAGLIFLLSPKKVLNVIEAELDNEIKGENLSSNHLEQVKAEFTERIEVLGEALELVATSIKDMSENDKLSYKNKSTELIDNLSNRVCSTCERGVRCWKREFNQTYIAVERLIQSREEGYPEFPSDLEKKCKHKRLLVKEADNIVNISKIQELERRRIEEGRKIVSNHIVNISKNLDHMFDDFKRDVSWCGNLERVVRKELNKNSIKYKDIFCYTDKGGKLKVRINMENCEGGRYCAKNVLPIINDIVRTPMTLGEDGCRINPNNKDCTVTLSEVPKYQVISYAAMDIKEGEKYTGDSYTFGKAGNGKYITILSDGMGSGPEAGRDSRITVDLVEKFMQSGFDIDTSLNTVNSIMSMKFDESEKYSTLDMNMIDLYTGKVKFYKVGATTSFIKRGKTIKKISSNMPPFGLMDRMEVEGLEETLRDGDFIITLSDGVLDVCKSEVGNSAWLENYLQGNKSGARDLVTDILEESKRVNNGRIKDDMTIVVSRVSAVY
ncbi:MAG: stage II sporulation protein E [Clostridium chrysemydis]|uniref:stage II sporulation protein E n=1 Tax=Clostridium chrysemydis TaxID=2665504 RepID=UPI003F2BDD23